MIRRTKTVPKSILQTTGHLTERSVSRPRGLASSARVANRPALQTRGKRALRKANLTTATHLKFIARSILGQVVPVDRGCITQLRVVLECNQTALDGGQIVQADLLQMICVAHVQSIPVGEQLLSADHR